MLKGLLARIARWIPFYRELLQVRDLLRSVHDDVARLRNLNAAVYCDLELERNPRFREPGRLQRHAFQVNSQGGEDGILHEIFRRIGVTDRTFVEIGVGDGTENNTAFLLSMGWSGFWVDADRAFLQTIERRGDIPGNRLRTAVCVADAQNVVPCLEQLGAPREFDLLSLDVDQNTFHLWEALQVFRPRVVVVEYNAAIPADVEWSARYEPGRVWDGTQNFGASLKSFEALGRRLGYGLVGCDFTGVNAFFVRQELLADRFAAPFTAENHYEPPRYHLVHRRTHAGSILDRSGTAEPKR